MSAEIERMIANLVRVGTIAELDETNARVRMAVGGLTTDWLPWGVSRAGATRTWSAPRVGDQHVLFSPYGDPSQGVVGPALYQDSQPAPAASKDQEHTLYPDGSTVDYNSATNTLTVTIAAGGNVVVNCKHATINAADDATVNTKVAAIKASTSVEIDSPATTVTGKLTVEGLLTYKAGLAGSGGSGAVLTGDFKAQGGAFQHNGKNVGDTQRVTGIQPGGGTSGPTA